VLSNQTRAEEVKPWDHLAAVNYPALGSTAAQRAKDKRAIAALLACIANVFAPRNCGKLYRLPFG
jgi:hypothetical protein